jgi:hypothetical protein
MRMARRSAGAVAIASLTSVLAPAALPAVAATHRRAPTALVPLPPPKPLVPFDPAAGPTQGRWHPAGRLVDGRAAVYETNLVVPATGQEAGVAWMDPRLLRAELYSGSQGPGGGPWKLTAPISPSGARTLVAAFNGGFRYCSGGGYYSEGKLACPLAQGGASFVIYRNGDATVGAWGREVSMSKQVIAVRQDATMLVDGGQVVAGLNPYDISVFGLTLGGIPNVWRAGVGVRAKGALVYVYGPDLEVTQLAQLLVRAQAVRAMTLDINPDWTVFVTYKPPPGVLASPTNGSSLLPGTIQGAATFFDPSWSRDFITMSAR